MEQSTIEQPDVPRLQSLEIPASSDRSLSLKTPPALIYEPWLQNAFSQPTLSASQADGSETFTPSLLTAFAKSDAHQYQFLNSSTVVDAAPWNQDPIRASLIGSSNTRMHEDQPWQQYTASHATTQGGRSQGKPDSKFGTFLTQSISSISPSDWHPDLPGIETDSLTLHDERGFRCDLCGRCLVTNKDLKRHMVKHDGEKVHKHHCPTCGVGFRYPKDLARHKASLHALSAASHICDLCGASYKRNDHLMRHRRKAHFTGARAGPSTLNDTSPGLTLSSRNSETSSQQTSDLAHMRTDFDLAKGMLGKGGAWKSNAYD